MTATPGNPGCTKDSGTCRQCQSGCTRKPGWFLPGEAERAAAYLDMPMQQFFDTYLAVDYWARTEHDGGHIYVLAPGVVGQATGTEYPLNPGGTCVFYKKGRCSIHEVKPYECRESWCGAGSEVPIMHEKIPEHWVKHRGDIVRLLGREPSAGEPTIFDLLKMMTE